MSLSIDAARGLVETMRSGQIQNLIAQAKSKQVLNEVDELPQNFPQFEADVDDRVTYVAYALLAAGCSLIERGESVDGQAELLRAAGILESTHKTDAALDSASRMHTLIGAMAFYASGQYSRAFVLVGKIEQSTDACRLIAAFLRKDRSTLVSRLNDILLAQQPDLVDRREYDDWALTMMIAKAVQLIFEHAHNGNGELLDAADSTLQDALIVSEAGSNPGYWWIVRLLRLMLRDYRAGSLWSVLPRHFGPDQQRQVEAYVRHLAFLNKPVIELWKSQIDSLSIALAPEKQGAVINLRTSAGKTRVAELSILKVLADDPNAKVLYLAPFRSLAFELEKTLGTTLGPLGYSVSHLYGGHRFGVLDEELVGEGRITIATPEKAKAMLRAVPELFDDIKLIVIDEGHLIGGRERDVRNEVFFESLRLRAKATGARVLMLSAVLPNAEELAAWLAGDPGSVVRSPWKPSEERFGKLYWKGTGVWIEWLGGHRCFNPNFVEFTQPKLTAKGNPSKIIFPRTKNEAVAATAARLAALGPVLIFTAQARSVPPMVRNAMWAIGLGASNHDWPVNEWRTFEAACNEELGPGSLELKAARAGVIAHSNNLPAQVRMAIDKLISCHPPLIVVATTTLGQGVNLGIASVIVASTSIGHNDPLDKRDFWNICGRAGRAFVDGEGKILFAIDQGPTRSAYDVRQDERKADAYFDIGAMERAESGLLSIVGLLREIALKTGVVFDNLIEMAANDQFDELSDYRDEVEERFDWIDDQLLAMHEAFTDAEDSAEWVDGAFRDSLAAIQERAADVEPGVVKFLKYRLKGLIGKVPTAEARRAIIASGLPFAVGVAAFRDLDHFRELIDAYIASGQTLADLSRLIAEIENWAPVNARTMFRNLPDADTLENVRRDWLNGLPLTEIAGSHGRVPANACLQVFGYQLPWLINAIAQKFDKRTEAVRVETLTRVALLAELGLSTDAAAKVFLAGVRSRSAASELSGLITIEGNDSITKVRNKILALSNSPTETATATLSATAIDWIQAVRDEHELSRAGDFHLQTIYLENIPLHVSELHVRRWSFDDSIYLCSSDMTFKLLAVDDETRLQVEPFSNDVRYVFERTGESWTLRSRHRPF